MHSRIIYRATILSPAGRRSRNFVILQDAYNWLDSENNNYESTTMVEFIEEDTGRKVDGFFYTQAI